MNAVNEVVARLRQSSGDLTEGRVVAGLYFSFWSAMFGHAYTDVWRGELELAKAFPYAPDQKYIVSRANQLVQLRNRLAHHQPLLDVDVLAKLELAHELAGAIDTSARDWLRSVLRVERVLQERPS